MKRFWPFRRNKPKKLSVVVFNNSDFNNGEPIYVDLPEEFRPLSEKFHLIRFTLTQSLNNIDIFFEALLPIRKGTMTILSPMGGASIDLRIQVAVKRALKDMLV